MCLASEEQVESLMGQLEIAINEADRLEKQLDSYDEILCHVRDTMEKMEKKNSMISVVDKNNQLLLQELEKIVVCGSYATQNTVILHLLHSIFSIILK
jgi:hypothetical protein